MWVAAPAQTVFDLIADLGNWPRVFPSFVHLEPVGTVEDRERIHVWTVSGEAIDFWGIRRTVHSDELRIEMSPENPQPPLTEMLRILEVRPLSSDRSEVVLRHDYRTDPSGAEENVAGAIDQVAEGELDALAAAAELEHARPDLVVVVEDTVSTTGGADDAFEFLHDAEHWTERLSHVARVSVRPGPEGTQIVETVTDEGEGRELTTRVARVRRPGRTLFFRHLVLPPIGRVHHVRWAVQETDDGATITSSQTVVIDPEGAKQMLGSEVDLNAAESFVRNELSTKARLVLDGASAFAERRARERMGARSR
ncbi:MULTISPECIES: SRPBCC family protein [unclassified Actinopolyspora]|uniref:SRPBCC family protein n=1 Tax=unclassified Actinopolyspora TaxID=2639451 RepID=UPI0013F67136|nr:MULTISPECIES: SRPBCC family protein [unclassified Actinopolyspora]NHD19339.1 hypothetical protein [Actinopolyspora sp. BKK2]NHE78463.1 hypothetical protein [Actinopolyspora sp. BKK1]